MLSSICLQSDQEEELPVGSEALDGEEQPGGEGAPAEPPALEGAGRLVLSTASSILRDRELQEVRDPPGSRDHPSPAAEDRW